MSLNFYEYFPWISKKTYWNLKEDTVPLILAATKLGRTNKLHLNWQRLELFCYLNVNFFHYSFLAVPHHLKFHHVFMIRWPFGRAHKRSQALPVFILLVEHVGTSILKVSTCFTNKMNTVKTGRNAIKREKVIQDVFTVLKRSKISNALKRNVTGWSQ